MTRWLTAVLAAAALLALPTLAGAAAYTFPGALPPGCSGSAGSYTCSGGSSLGSGDTVTINTPRPATITVNGNFSTDSAQINQAGVASDLTLIVNGTLTLGYNARIKANITATAVNDAGGGNVTLTGNLTGNGGNISLAYQTAVTGNVSTTGAGTITLIQANSIGGNVSGGTGAISIGETGTVAGSVTGSGNITVAQSATVSGSLNAGSGAVDLGYQARVNGNLGSTGAITLGQGAQVGGNISGGAGNVSVGFGATVTGTLTAGSGTVSFAQSAKALACVRSTGSASITLGYQSTVNSVCCGSSCTSSCVTNNSTYAMPALCAAPTTLLADYRMDETTAWNGTATEVKDSSGNGHHARAATASAGTPVATTASGSPAVGTAASGSCGYGSFNRSSPVAASHAYVQLPGSFPSLTSNFTVLAWVRSPAPDQAGQRILANDDNQNGWALSLGDANGLRLRFFNRNVRAAGSVMTSGSAGSGATNTSCSDTLCLDSAAVFSAGTWYYVVALVDTSNKQVTLQVYNSSGTLLSGAATAYTGTWTAGSGATSIGGESINSSEGLQSAFHFNGNIDELQVYSGLLDSTAITAQRSRTRSCPAPAITGFTTGGTGSASTCSAPTLTITARDSNGATLTNYTGTVSLTTSTGDGDWSAGAGPAPSGTLVPGAANSGLASYTFAAADAGIVKLRLAHSLAQNVTVNVVDGLVAGTSSNSAAINYRDNAFVWSEDAGGLVAGTFAAVAGRPHDMRVTLIKKDTTTGSCGIATDYSGSRNLKLWRSDNGSTWTAPGVISPALSPVPAARPASNNLTLSFTAGVANFNLATTNVGKYAFSLDDDSLSYAATTVSGTSSDLTVRPFTLAVTGLTASGINNPGGSTVADGVFAKAGAPFSATVTAYRWSAGADANNDGLPDAGVMLAQVSAGGVAAGFNASVSLTAAAGSQTPATGVLGTLGNNVLSSFSNGTVTAANVGYSEVGSFQLNTTSVVGAYLGTAGLNLDALVFNAAGAQQTRVGRFIPAGFALSLPGTAHRIKQSCPVASSFTYLDEDFSLVFTLTAQNLAGATTQNYIGAFARLDLATAANFRLAGVDGSTQFKTGNASLVLGTSSSAAGWVNGVAAVTLPARVPRSTTPVGPFDSADFGVAPVDLDGATMLSLDLNTDGIAGNDSFKVGRIPLRFGRLRLQNGMGPANRKLNLALDAQFWNSTAYNTNTLDSCTRISATNLSFGNLRKTLVASDAAMVGTAVTVAQGKGSITLAAPASGHVGSLDVAIALDTAAPPADLSCLKTQAGWAATRAATVGAGHTALRGPWCGNAFSDPGARATWGAYRGSDGVLYQRENY